MKEPLEEVFTHKASASGLMDFLVDADGAHAALVCSSSFNIHDPKTRDLYERRIALLQNSPRLLRALKSLFECATVREFPSVDEIAEARKVIADCGVLKV